jgi:hypothetical protein
MLRGYWGIILALGLILAGHHPNAVAQPKQESAADRGARALQSLASRYDEQTKGAERSSYEQPCKQGDDKRNSDLCAQWKAADAAAGSARWAAISGFATAASTLLVLVALYFAFRSNWIARDTARRELRAYLVFRNVRCEFTTMSDYEVHGEIVNVGQTPAYDVQVRGRAMIWADNEIPPAFTYDLQGLGKAIIGPQGDLGHEFIIENMSPERKAGFRAGSQKLYAIGRVQYEDIFRRVFAYNFAAVSDKFGSGRLTPCEWGNNERYIRKRPLSEDW